MKQKVIILQFILTFCCLGITKAQQSPIYPLLAMEVQTTHSDGDSISNGFLEMSDTTLFNAHMLISLFDTSGISAIHVNLGHSAGNYDLLQTSFAFDAFGNLSGGKSYSRDGYNIDLGLGSFLGIVRFYSEVTIEKSDGTFTSPVFYNR